GSSRLHDGLLVGGRNLRPRLPSGDGDPPRPGEASRGHLQGCARPSRDRQLPLRGCEWRPAPAWAWRYDGRCGAMSSGRLVCAASAWETLPRRALRMAPRPRWPQTISPASNSWAISSIILATDSLACAIRADAL